MPTGQNPTYRYVPTKKAGDPVLRMISARRARLFDAGTYFRSRQVGLQGNNISIQIVEVSPTSGPGTGEGYCVVTNHNIQADENVVGADVSILDLKGSYSDYWIIDQLDTPTPRTQQYSISLRIRFQIQEGLPYVLPAPTIVPGFQPEKLFNVPGKLSVKTAKKTPNFTSVSTIIVTPRVRIYELSGATDGLVSGWDIEDLRTQINDNDPWIEMIQRDLMLDDQDEGSDDQYLSPIDATNLTGGDGLPKYPDRENTGPSRSLLKVNYGEQQDGKMGVHNVVYEWVGDSATLGSWQPY